MRMNPCRNFNTKRFSGHVSLFTAALPKVSHASRDQSFDSAIGTKGSNYGGSDFSFMLSHLLGLLTDTEHSGIEVNEVMAEFDKIRGPVQ